MANAYHHSWSSVKRWGGEIDDYKPIHDWFDASKEIHGDFRHRMLRHHTQGIFECERTFGTTLTLSTGKIIPVKWVAEQHVEEDMGFIPSFSDWCKALKSEDWMNRPRRLSREYDMGTLRADSEVNGAKVEANSITQEV